MLEIDGLATSGLALGDGTIQWKKELLENQVAIDADVRQADGQTKSKLTLQLGDNPESPLRASQLIDYHAQGQLENYRLNLGYGKSGAIEVQAVGQFAASGSPQNWLAQGTASLSNSVATLSDRTLNVELADISFNPEEIRLERFRILDSVGRVAGAASIQRNRTGQHRLRLRVVDVELQPYLIRLAPRKLPRINGLAAIELDLTKAAASDDLLEDWEGEWQGDLTQIEFRGKSLGNLNLNGKINSRWITASANGLLLGGTAEADLKFPVSQLKNSPGQPPEASSLVVKLGKLQVNRLMRLFFQRGPATKVIGTSDLQFTLEGTSAEDLVITSRLDTPLIREGRNRIAENLTVQLRYLENRVLIERVAGGFAGGEISLKGQLGLNAENLSQIDSSKVNFLVRRLDANRLVKLFYPDHAKYFAGIFDYRGIATYHRGFQLSGSAAVKNARLFEIPIQNARADLRTEFDAQGRFKKLVSQGLHGTGIGGRFNAELAIEQKSKFTLETSGTIDRGKLEQLSRALGFEQILGSGIFDGRFNLNSNQIESIAAMSGGLHVDFEGGNVNSIPILSSLDRLVPLSQFASTQIKSGSLNAKIGQGLLRMSDLTLFSDAFALAASGNATLDGGKLDIDAVLQTGSSFQSGLAQSAIRDSLVTSVPQVTLVLELNDLISNQSLFLHVGGSASRPVIQTKAGRSAAAAFLQIWGRRAAATSTIDD